MWQWFLWMNLKKKINKMRRNDTIKWHWYKREAENHIKNILGTKRGWFTKS